MKARLGKLETPEQFKEIHFSFEMYYREQIYALVYLAERYSVLPAGPILVRYNPARDELRFPDKRVASGLIRVKLEGSGSREKLQKLGYWFELIEK